MAKSKAFQEGSDYGFKRLLRHSPESECRYPIGSEERFEWFEGYYNGRRCEILT